MVLVYKKAPTFLVDVYNVINDTILVKFIQIKMDMPDVIIFGRWKSKM